MKKELVQTPKTNGETKPGFLVKVPEKSDFKEEFFKAGNEEFPAPAKLSAMNQFVAEAFTQQASDSDAIDKMIAAESAEVVIQAEIASDMADARVTSMLDTQAVDPDKKTLSEMDHDFRE